MSVTSITQTSKNASPSYIEQAEQLVKRTGVNIPLVEQADIFLSLAWQSLPAMGIVGLASDLKYFSEKRNEWAGTVDVEWAAAKDRSTVGLLEWAYKKNDDARLTAQGVGSIFWHFSSRKFQVASRKRERARGAYDELIAASAIGADIDCAETGTPLAVAFDTVMSAKLLPTAVVFSGGGLQPIYILSEAWLVPDRPSAQEYRQYSRGLIDGMFADSGLVFDTQVHEPTRMLRLPGFVNRKPKRDGAIAQLVYWNPDNLHTIEQIKAHAVIRHYVSEVPYIEPSESGTYVVGRDFVNHFCFDVIAPPSDRHHSLRSLACTAAHAKMPVEVLTPRLRALALKWFGMTGEDSRAGDELDSLIEWSYRNVGDMNWPNGTLVVKPTDSGFEQILDEEVERKVKDKQVLLDEQRARELLSDSDPAKIDEGRSILEALDRLQNVEGESQSRDDLRAAQDEWIQAYLDRQDRNLASVGLLQTSPGAGKSTAMLRTAYKRAEAAILRGETTEDNKGLALYLSQFKTGWAGEKDCINGELWLRELFKGTDVDPFAYPKMFGFFMARTNDKNSKGFCENNTKAQALGERGHNVVSELCHAGCPFFTSCQQRGYLSQFERLKDYWIVVGRYHHGMMDELSTGRKLVLCDESPLKLVEQPIKVIIDDLQVKDVSGWIEDQYPQQLSLLKEFLAACRSALAINLERNSKYDSVVKLGGYWFMAQLIERLGVERFEQAIKIDKKIIAGANGVDATSAASLSDTQPNFMQHMITLLEYEYNEHYKQGRTAWNSRLIPNGTTLEVHPMEPFRFPRATKVIVGDATSAEITASYAQAFSDEHTEQIEGTRRQAPRPRQVMTFGTQLEAKGHVTQYTGTEFTKNSAFSYYKEAQKLDIHDSAAALRSLDAIKIGDLWTLDDTIKLAKQLRAVKSYALAQLITITHSLSLRHKKNLLVVMYQRLAGKIDKEAEWGFFTKWAVKSGVVDAKNIQHFFNLRGKNDWKDCEAVLVVGTPRLKPDDVLIAAQLWHWREADPIKQAKRWRVEPYRGYRTGDGQALGYRYLGYDDDRVNDFYLQLASEIRQCADRIRPNSSDSARYVYVASEFPCMDHVNEFESWNSADTHAITKNTLETYHLTGRFSHDEAISEAELIDAIAEAAGCTTATARTHLLREYENGTSTTFGKLWSDLIPRHYGGAGKSNKYGVGASGKVAKVLNWLRATYDTLPAYTALESAFFSAFSEHLARSTYYEAKKLFDNERPKPANSSETVKANEIL